MTAQQTQWGPQTALIIWAGIGGIVLAVGAVTLVTDPPGRILIGLAAVGLLVFATMSWRARPKLAITENALVYHGWWRVRQLTPAEITRIRITEFRRIGRKVRLLEIDTADSQLLVLSRWDLGTDPLHVLDALTDAGYAPGAGSRRRCLGDRDRLDDDRVGGPIAAVGRRGRDRVDDLLGLGVDDITEDRVAAGSDAASR